MSVLSHKPANAVTERLRALQQPMPGHTTETMVDYEKRTRLHPPTGKVLVALLSILLLIVAAVTLLRLRGNEDPQHSPPSGVHRGHTGSHESGASGSPGAAHPRPADADKPYANVAELAQGAHSTDNPGAHQSNTNEECVISVQGSVHKPGLLTVKASTRIGQALDKAGGILPGSNIDALNLAEPVSDGMQITVSKKASSVRYAGDSPQHNPAARPGEAAPHSPPPTGKSGRPASGSGRGGSGSRKISLNTASQTELETLSGVGPATAAAIISWREANGGFRSVEQLMEVKGIGPAKFEAMKDGVGL